MKYLLDTCLISELVGKNPDRKVVKWVAECDEELAYLSVLTLGEIQKEISGIPDAKRKAALQKWLDTDLLARFGDRILPVSEEVAKTWGGLQAKAEFRRKPVSTLDGLLGATAITHHLTVITRRESDIHRTGAKVLNPWGP
ncbi:MAG: toxin, family [Fibrobacteres bacterium]|nr:toxin, family [Fibrobacterota bacterium]